MANEDMTAGCEDCKIRARCIEYKRMRCSSYEKEKNIKNTSDKCINMNKQ